MAMVDIESLVMGRLCDRPATRRDLVVFVSPWTAEPWRIVPMLAELRIDGLISHDGERYTATRRQWEAWVLKRRPMKRRYLH